MSEVKRVYAPVQPAPRRPGDCPFNAGVYCPPAERKLHPCSKCGWNPAAALARASARKTKEAGR